MLRTGLTPEDCREGGRVLVSVMYLRLMREFADMRKQREMQMIVRSIADQETADLLQLAYEHIAVILMPGPPISRCLSPIPRRIPVVILVEEERNRNRDVRQGSKRATSNRDSP